MELIIDIYGKIDYESDKDRFESDTEDIIRSRDGRKFKAKFAIYDLEEIVEDE